MLDHSSKTLKVEIFDDYCTGKTNEEVQEILDRIAEIAYSALRSMDEEEEQ